MHLDDQHPERSSVDVRIESASIETGEPMRDAHLRSAGFLDAVRFPEIEFRSTGLHRADDVLFQLAGDLTIFGRARSVVLEVAALGVTRDPAGNQRAGFSARTAIERHEFGLEWNEGGAGQEALVGDEIEVWIELEAMERSERPAVPPVAEPAAAG
jgi:polyisoprenoid-binding protein YceI